MHLFLSCHCKMWWVGEKSVLPYFEVALLITAQLCKKHCMMSCESSSRWSANRKVVLLSDTAGVSDHETLFNTCQYGILTGLSGIPSNISRKHGKACGQWVHGKSNLQQIGSMENLIFGIIRQMSMVNIAPGIKPKLHL